jgi:hypothetical protein
MIFLSPPAYAQLSGGDFAAGDSCAAYPQGATTMVADSDLDGGSVILICDGTNWQVAAGDSVSLKNLGDVFHDTTTNFDGDGNNNDDNLFLGHEALSLDGTNPGARNLAIGATALDAVTTGDANIAIGYDAATSITSGFYNIAIGWDALRAATTPQSNLAIGRMSLHKNTTGFLNVALGASTLVENTEGFYNTAIGVQTLINNTIGGSNTAVGALAGGGPVANGEMSFNTFVGARAGEDVQGGASGSGGDYNVMLGASAGDDLRTGDYNIFIGYNVNAVGGIGASNELNIGDVIYGSGMYNAGAMIGINESSPSAALDVIGDIHYTGVLQDVSDARLKDNITPLEGSLERVVTLGGYSFTMKEDEAGVVEYGLLAQEVEQVFPELVTTGDDGFKTMNYIGMIAPLVEAVKAQQAQIEALEARIEQLEQ